MKSRFLSVILTTMAILMPAKLLAQEPYAVLSNENTVLTFYYDDQKTARGGMDVEPVGWEDQRASITNVVFDDSFAGCTTLTSTSSWFQGCENLTSILGISNLKTDNVTNMWGMFSGCSSLTSLDVSSFNTADVKQMERMFEGCSALTTLDLSSFNTGNVMNMYSMFELCSNLTSLDVSNFKTEQVTSMRSMFDGCSSLTSIDVSSFNTTNVTNMYRMFHNCSSLTSLDVSGFNTANVTRIDDMFYGCTGLTSLDLSGFNTSNVTNMSNMFRGCSGLTSLDISNFNTANVTNMDAMFFVCTGLTILDLSGFNTSNVTNMDYMFNSCTKLKTIFVGNDWSTASVESGNYMFAGSTVLVGGAGTHYDENNTDYTYAHIDQGTSNPGYFTAAGAEPWVDQEPYAVLSDGNTVLTFYYDDQKTARGGMDVGPFASPGERGWYDDLDITSVIFDDSFANYTDLTSTAYWFYGLENLTSILGINNLNTANVTDMTWMFRDCSGLMSLDLSGFNTENVTEMAYIFADCSSLAAIQAGNANIPAEQYAQIGNPNLLVYVNNASLAPQGIQNVVIDGVAKEIILRDTIAGNNNWYCPQPFTAQKISYTRNFQQQTQIGVARGWETIALPFDVQTITYEDNRTISPFGDYSSNYHFWLRRLTQNGLQSVQEIHANMAYVISMPNSSEYPTEYNLAGKVTFSAEDAPIPETYPEMDETDDIAMAPAFQRIEVDEHIYALNVGEPRGNHPEGSVFERNYREVRPFEAFTKHFNENGARFMSIADMLDGGVTGIEELKSGKTEGLKSENWYDLNGRRISSPSKGVYIHNGKQVIVK